MFLSLILVSDSDNQPLMKPLIFFVDDLNSLYVYESKMSLFIRMTQTRAGAERLLEARLLTILAQCDYLDTRPEANQLFIGTVIKLVPCSLLLKHVLDQDSFLPSAIQRYHQLFMPALQVVDGLLATLGSKHATANHQVCFGIVKICRFIHFIF